MLDQNHAHAQLALDIQLRDDAVFSSFYPAENLEALLAVKKLVQGKGPLIEKSGEGDEGNKAAETFVYLWGGTSVGKSHLLQAACQEAFDLGLTAVYIPFKKMMNFSTSLLDELEKVPLVCLDDIQYVSHNLGWEEALFHFYNRIREQNQAANGNLNQHGQFQHPCRLIVSANASPLQINMSLADLKSRLSSGLTYQLHLMTDEQKLEALQLRAQCRGLELNRVVAQFLLSHCPRNMQKLFEILEKLDQASLAEQRRLTIPFVKQILKDNRA